MQTLHKAKEKLNPAHPLKTAISPNIKVINPLRREEKLAPQFNSYMWGGFECAFPRIETKERIDLLATSKHVICCRADYRMLKNLGISTVREGLAWSQIDKGSSRYDFSRFERMMMIAKEEGIQQIWDLNHFDYPDDIKDVMTDAFVLRFANYARAAVNVIRKYQKGTLYIVPINEISFWAHMGGMVGLWAPYMLTRGYNFKKQLVKASIAAMNAIWKIDHDVRFIQVDPIFYKTVKEPANEIRRMAAKMFIEIKFQTFDMLTGRIEPQLGGHPKYLDIIGGNYYPYNQDWITGDDPYDETCHEIIPWSSKARISLADILEELYVRYSRPIVITETGSWGDQRVKWWRRVLKEVKEAHSRKIPLYGVCAYPIIDRHDWHDGHVTNSGFWDFEENSDSCKRIPHQETISIIKRFIDRQKT